MRPTIICLINQKGGCGKSSSCFHLAGHFAQTGWRVLLVDTDPQGSLSQGLLGSEFVESLEPQETLAALFREDLFVAPTSLVAATPFENIHLVRANQHLAAHNAPLPENTGLRQFALQAFLGALAGYDLVLIDCPPNLYLCSWNALVAADFVLVPVPPEDFGTQGLRAVHQAIDNATLLNPKLELLGHLVTRRDGRLLVHQAYEQRLRRLYGDLVLQTVIPEASAFKVALACREPVNVYAPRSKAARLTSELGREIVERISQRRRHQSVA